MMLARAAGLLGVAWGVTIVSFVMVAALPGAAVAWLGADASPAQVARLEAQLGLDRPWAERYLEWLGGVARGDLGTSMASAEPVIDMLARRMPVTLVLCGYAVGMALAVAVPLALACAYAPGAALDRVVLAASAAALAVPGYVLALALIVVCAITWPLFPAISPAPFDDGAGAHLRAMALPSLSIAVPLAALYTRVLRADLIEQFAREPYIVAAAAKGLSHQVVLMRHALRPSLAGLTTVVALGMAPLVGGAVVIEQLFALPGIGSLMLQSVALGDTPVVQGIVLAIALLTVALHGALDALHGVLDPRVACSTWRSIFAWRAPRGARSSRGVMHRVPDPGVAFSRGDDEAVAAKVRSR